MGKKTMVGMLLKSPNADPYTQSTYVINDDAIVIIFTVKDGEQGINFAKAMADVGFDRIDLCPEFIADEVEKIKYLVAGNSRVGVVKLCGSKLCSQCLLESL